MATQLARKAEAALMVALTLQLIASVACGHGRNLLRGQTASTAGTEVDFGLQHPGLAATQHLGRRARTMYADRKAEETYEDWNNLQDGYDAELRLHRQRLAVTTDIQLQSAQPRTVVQQHALVHRPLYIAALLEPNLGHAATQEETRGYENDLSHEGGQHTVDQAPAEDSDDAYGEPGATEDIHSSEEIAAGAEADSASGKGHRLFARRLLFVPEPVQQQQERQQPQPHHGLTWPSRQLQHLGLSSPFGPMGLFSSAVDPTEMSSASTH